MDVKTLFDKQPDEIIAYFKAKKNAKSWDWDDIWQEAHHKAFTVAKCMKADILQDIRDEVEKAIAGGTPFAVFKKNLTPILQKKGWWGKKELVNPKTGEVQSVQLGSVRRLETIYRTNMRTAFMTGRYQSMTANAKNKPYWRYVCRMKPSSRDEHKALHNKVFRFDDPIWETMYPPNGWNCGCRVEPMDKEDIEYFNTHLPKWQSKLAMESSRGKLAKQEKMVSVRGGEAKLQTVTGYRDPKTGKIISPAPGWNYNVGKTAWEPDLKKYDKEIREGLTKELKKAVIAKNPGAGIPTAKTIEEAEKIAEKFCSPKIMASTFKGKAQYKGISLENANKINQALFEVYNTLNLEKISGIRSVSPTSALGKKAFKSGADAVFSYNPVENGIFINKDIIKNVTTFEDYVKRSEEAWNTVMSNIEKLKGAQKELALRYRNAGRSLVEGKTIEGMFTHELGHHVQWTLLDAATNNAVGKNMSKYAPKISGYANHSKGEYLAESFSAYMKGERENLDPLFVRFIDEKRIAKKKNSDIRKVRIKELSPLKTPEVKISFSDREEENGANIPFISKQIKSAFQEIGDPNPPEVVFNTEIFKRQYGERYAEIPAAYERVSGVIFINKNAKLFRNEAKFTKHMIKQTTEKMFSSNKKSHFIIHEYFHAQLNKRDPALYQKLSKHIFTQEEKEIIKENLSSYAYENGLEFVAEYETREFFHLPIDAKTKKIYDKLMKGG